MDILVSSAPCSSETHALFLAPGSSTTQSRVPVGVKVTRPPPPGAPPLHPFRPPVGPARIGQMCKGRKLAPALSQHLCTLLFWKLAALLWDGTHSWKSHGPQPLPYPSLSISGDFIGGGSVWGPMTPPEADGQGPDVLGPVEPSHL